MGFHWKPLGGVVMAAEDLIKNNSKVKKVTDNNFEIGKKNFSYQKVEKKIQKILSEM